MAQTLTDLLEMAVGLTCLIGAVLAWRRGLRWAAIPLAVAGIAAAGHALVSLA